MENRITYLDGLRGVAVLLVVSFHAYARWSGLLPYGARYEPFFRFGWVGVELFFLISGFVILMTLEKSAGVGDFLFRRWTRLFPAMLVCSLLIFGTAALFRERPGGSPTAASLIPGLLFMEPAWLRHAFHVSLPELEGDFWSLYVEFKFYVLAGLIYFWLGRRGLIAALVAMGLLGMVATLLGSEHVPRVLGLLFKISNNLSFEYFGWFAAGAAIYVYAKCKTLRWLLAGALLAFSSAALAGMHSRGSLLATSSVATLFLLAAIWPGMRSLLSVRLVLFFGFISYPLYLLHENIMVASIIKLGSSGVTMPGLAYPLLPLAGLCLVAYVVAKYVEPKGRHALQRFRDVLAAHGRRAEPAHSGET